MELKQVVEWNRILHGMECKQKNGMESGWNGTELYMEWNANLVGSGIYIMAEWNGNQGVSYLGKHGLASAWSPIHQHVAIDTSVPTCVDGC